MDANVKRHLLNNANRMIHMAVDGETIGRFKIPAEGDREAYEAENIIELSCDGVRVMLTFFDEADLSRMADVCLELLDANRDRRKRNGEP